MAKTVKRKRFRAGHIVYLFAVSVFLLFLVLYVKLQVPECYSISANDYNGELGKEILQGATLESDADIGMNKNGEATAGTDTGIASLKSEIAEYLKALKGKYGVYYINLKDGEEFGINEYDPYIAASTVKIPLNLYLYTRIKEGSIKWDDTVLYIRDDYEGGTGRLQYTEEPGASLTIRELSELSIRLSDNIAANMLIRYLGRKNIKDSMRTLGGRIVYDDDNTSCPADMAVYMKSVYEFYEEGGPGKELMEHFENTIFNERIPRYIPENIRIAHKTGNQTGTVHDIGIVFAREPYIISIMSEGVSDEEGNEVIAGISKKVFDFVENK